jgi:hypothetical protein
MVRDWCVMNLRVNRSDVTNFQRRNIRAQ